MCERDKAPQSGQEAKVSSDRLCIMIPGHVGQCVPGSVEIGPDQTTCPGPAAPARRSVASRLSDPGSARAVTSALVLGLETTGGASIGAYGQPVPAAGFAVATDRPDLSAIHESTAYGVRQADVAAWVEHVRPFVLSHPGCVYGAWIGDDGMIYLDVSEIVPTLTEAVALGNARNQRAVYSLELGEDVACEGTGALMGADESQCDCAAVVGPHLVHCDECSAPIDRCVCDAASGARTHQRKNVSALILA